MSADLNAENDRRCQCGHREHEHEPEGECYFCDCRSWLQIDGEVSS